MCEKIVNRFGGGLGLCVTLEFVPCLEELLWIGGEFRGPFEFLEVILQTQT